MTMNHNDAIRTSPEPAEHPEDPQTQAQDSWTIQERRPRQMSAEYFDPSGVQELSDALRHVLDDINVPEVELSSASRRATMDSDSMMRELFSPHEMLEAGLQDLGVTFEDLRVVGSGAAVAVQPTVASILNPLSLVRLLGTLRYPELHDIISGFEGSVHPGEMLLVLGRSGAGTSTLLRVLANQRRGYHKITGDVYYDWISPLEMDKHYRGDVQFYPANDLHFSNLTVEQTILFAARTRVAQGRIYGFDKNDYARLVTEACITVMGLKSVRNTPIGRLTLLEQKRVSVCETLVTRSRITCWDSSLTDFDESGALEFVQALRLATNLVHSTTLVTTYKGSESIYNLFDKVCLIYEGKMIYYGPSDRAKQYFIDMGYQPFHRQTTIEFLLALTDERSRRLFVKTQSVPRTPSEFAWYYKHSQMRKENRIAMRLYQHDTMPREGEAPRRPRVRRKNAYILSFLEQLRLVLGRRFQIMKFDLIFHLFYLFGATCEGIMLGATFNDLKDIALHYFSRAGIFFLTIMIPTIFNLSEITFFVSQRATILSHRQLAMYHPGIAALSLSLMDIPYNIIKMLPFTLVIYFMTGLTRTAHQYLTFYLINIIQSLCMRAYARALAALLGNDSIAQGIGGIIFLMASIYIGFELPERAMVKGLKWIMYINPMRYAFEAMMGNEFKSLDGPCAHPVPSGPGYEGVSPANQVCTFLGGWPGDSKVNGRDYVNEYFSFDVNKVWKNIGILFAFYGGFVIAFLLVTEFSGSSPGRGPVILTKRSSSSPTKKAIFSGLGKRDEEKGEMDDDPPIDSLGWGSQEAVEAMRKLHKMRHSFCWHNVGYTIQLPRSKLRMLDGVSGYILPGQMVAVIGEPGSGKRTLVKVISERVDEGWISGNRFVDWNRLPPDYQTQTGYCHNVDIHVPTVTVYAAFRGTALMRQPPDIKHEEILSYARTCVRACGLDDVADAMIGSLKPEQRRRVTIGMELAARPQLLFLDSPTTGLDLQSALAIMNFLRDLVNCGMTIVCSLHQPSAAVFELFDQVLVLQKLGRSAYFGDMGPDCSAVVKYFEARSSKVCGSNDNPADFIVDALTNTILDKDWSTIWRESDEFKKMRNKIHTSVCEVRSREPMPARRTTRYSRSWLYQFRILYRRQSRYFWRSPNYILPKLFLNVIGGLFVGFSYYHTDNSLLGARSKLFSIYSGAFLSVPLGFLMLFPYFDIRSVYENRERANISYRRSALTAAQLFSEIPWNILGSSLYFITWYWAVGFPTSRAALSYFVYGVLFPTYYASLAICLGSMSPTAAVGAFLYSIIMSYIFTFDDTVQPFSEMGWFRWLYYITPFTYVTDSIYGYTMGHSYVECSADELSVIMPPSGLTCGAYLAEYIDREGGYLLNPSSRNNCVYCINLYYDHWMRTYYNISYTHRWRDVGILLGYISFHIFLTFLSSYLMGHWHMAHCKIRVQAFLHKLHLAKLSIPVFT